MTFVYDQSAESGNSRTSKESNDFHRVRTKGLGPSAILLALGIALAAAAPLSAAPQASFSIQRITDATVETSLHTVENGDAAHTWWATDRKLDPKTYSRAYLKTQ